MKTLMTTSILCLITLSVWAQTNVDPVALDYNIGAFKIGHSLDQKIKDKFNQLNTNRSYVVTIVGSADFLGSNDNNQVLSNKRVKFAEYHLLKNYSNLRLIIKLDSKGEMNPANRNQTNQGIQDHRMVYLYVDEYSPSNPVSSAPSREAVPADNSNTNFSNDLHGRTVATRAAQRAENLTDVAVAVTQESNKPISETARIEIAKQEAEARRLAESSNSTTAQSQVPTAVANDFNQVNTDAAINENPEPIADSGTMNVKGNKKPKKFDVDGKFAVGEKLLLSDLNFRPGSHYLRPSSIPTLRKLIDVLEANPTLKIEIIGHICCHPDYSVHLDGFDREAGNHKLSFNRASNIIEYLGKNGIDVSRLTAKGMGARERLVFPEETDEDRITNRRVEIKIISL